MTKLQAIAVFVGLLLIFGGGDGSIVGPVSGERQLTIVYETAESTPALAMLITSLRNPPHSEYLESKGHTLDVLDDESTDLPDGLTIAAGDKVLHQGATPATADAVIETLKANGG